MKLTEEDYCYLFPLFSASEIANKFKDASLTERGIQYLWAKKFKKPQRYSLKHLIDASLTISPLDVDEYTWYEWVSEQIHNERTVRLEMVTARLEQSERVYA